MTKNEWRQKKLEALKTLDAETKEYWDNIIYEKVITYDVLKVEQVVACFWPMNHEINTKLLINWLWAQNYPVYLPRIENEGLIFYQVKSESDFEFNTRYNVYEPKSINQQLNLKTLTLIFVPFIAFTENHYRIGYGKGFYDKFFEQTKEVKCLKVGLGYKIQKIIEKNYQADKWDIPLDLVITN